MSDITVAFRAKDPESVQRWKSRVDLSFRRWKMQVDNLKRELRIGDPVVRTDFTTCWIIGYKVSDATPPRIGFRRDQRTGYILPEEFSTEGKAVTRRLAELRYTVGGAPGLPDYIHGVDRFGPFKVHNVGSDWFAVLNFPASEESLSSVDASQWTRMDLEAYEMYQNIPETVSENSYS